MLSIRNRLYLGFGLILLFGLVQFIVIFTLLKQSQTLVNQATDVDFHNSVDIARMGMEAHKLRRFEKEYLIYVASPGKRGKYFDDWKQSHGEILKQLDGMIENREQRWSAADIASARVWQKALTDYEKGFTTVASLVDSGQIVNTLQGNEAVGPAKDAFRPLLDGTARAIDQKYAEATASAKAVDGKFLLVTVVLVIIGLAGFGLAGYLLVHIPASIASPIEALTRAAHDMSTGNLAKKVDVGGTAEFKELGETLERMRVAQQMMLDRLKSQLKIS